MTYAFYECIRSRIVWSFTPCKKFHIRLLVWLQFGKNCKILSQKLGGHFAVRGATRLSLELYGQQLVILLAVPIMAVNIAKIVRFGSPSAERGAVNVGRQVEQILANFGKTLTSEGCRGAPSGPILLRFAPKFLESIPVSGNLGEISFLWSPCRGVPNPTTKGLLTFAMLLSL